jgi:GNAT acetyltransferase-like protein
MRIIWDQTTRDQWHDLLGRVPKSNLLNTWSYAHAVRQNRQLMTRFGVIEKEGLPRGLLEIQEAGLGKIIHALTIHRGPLWLDEPASAGEWQKFLSVLAREFPPRLGRIRRFLPELEDTPQAHDWMRAAGFKWVGDGYQTVWLDLRPGLATLRKNLKQKWRNSLNGSAKEGLELDSDNSDQASAWLLSRYEADKAERKYGGAAQGFLETMRTAGAPEDTSLVLRAMLEGEAIAGVLIFKHGTSATYQVGWTSDEGRKARAHHFLLWQAISTLKDQGTTWFDLGGINPGEAEGVTRFKSGLGGTGYKTIGLYK